MSVVFFLHLSLDKAVVGECLNGGTYVVAIFSFMMYLLKAVRRSTAAYMQGPLKNISFCDPGFGLWREV